MATALTVVQKYPEVTELETKPAELVKRIGDWFLGFQDKAEALGPVDFGAMLSLKVTDEESCRVAIEDGHKAKAYAGLLDEPRDAGNQLHKLFTGYIKTLAEIQKHDREELRLWEYQKAQRRQALETELRQAQNEARAGAIQALTQKRAAPNLMPWDVLAIDKQLQAIENEPPVTLAEEPTPAGMQLRSAPDSYAIDWPVLLQACLENPELRERVISENAGYLKKMLKILGKEIATKIPGVRLVEDTVVALV